MPKAFPPISYAVLMLRRGIGEDILSVTAAGGIIRTCSGKANPILSDTFFKFVSRIKAT